MLSVSAAQGPACSDRSFRLSGQGVSYKIEPSVVLSLDAHLAGPAFAVAMPNRIAQIFPTEDAFLAAAQAAIRNCRFERYDVNDKEYMLRVHGHTTPLKMRLKEWRPFRGHEWRLAPYEGPVIAVTDFVIRSLNVRTMYDIGAGIGVHAFMAATVDGHEVVVHAFEMQPELYRRMAALAAENPAVRERLVPHLAGLSDHHTGRRTVWYSRRNLYESKPNERDIRVPWHRQLKFWWLGRPNTTALREAEICLTTIDQFSQDNGAAPELIKLDVDGYEAKVLSGARDTLKARPIILLELHKDKLLQRFESQRSDVVARLFDEGYRAALFTDHNDLTTCQLRKVERNDPSFSEQATMMYLFY